MPQQDVDQMSTTTKRLGGLAAALGTQLPGISFFLGATPPGFRILSLLTIGGTLAIFFYIFSMGLAKSDCIRKGAKAIGVAIVLALTYTFIFPNLTAEPPPQRHEHLRIGVGFGLADFSLTQDARDVMQQNHLATKEDLMLARGAYENGDASLVWKPWTINVAAGLLDVLFVATYVFWACGIAWLACSLKKKQP